MNRVDKNLRQKEYRESNGNACTKKYEKTQKGFLVRLYRNMESRVTGVQSKKAHLYEGKELLDRDLFYEWSLAPPEFQELFLLWELSGYARRLCPSVDRVESSDGYRLDNMEWVTFSENCRRGALSRHAIVRGGV